MKEEGESKKSRTTKGKTRMDFVCSSSSSSLSSSSSSSVLFRLPCSFRFPFILAALFFPLSFLCLILLLLFLPLLLLFFLFFLVVFYLQLFGLAARRGGRQLRRADTRHVFTLDLVRVWFIQEKKGKKKENKEKGKDKRKKAKKGGRETERERERERERV